jgi:hypothetical protein
MKMNLRGSILAVVTLACLTQYGYTSQCLTVPPGAGCNVPGSLNVCTITPSVGIYTECSTVCPTGDSGCYYRNPSDSSSSCSPAIACYSTETCNCLPGGHCASDGDCIGANQTCDAMSHICTMKSSSGTSVKLKHYNNGTVNCATYCAGAQWGPVGPCAGSKIDQYFCDRLPGLLPDAEDTCWCKDAQGQQFIKHGNNGTVTCNTFCAGPQWGPAGSCLAAAIPNTARCDLNPGFLGSEMGCYCIY